ncbi:MAG TPA: SRPBCC domain-containing protein [Cytophagaceae bacterium]|jgi:activator of HSP90 ATPase|nr:SRPBCC domain-containing protein [Cytophagaceae bacterium]
MKEFKKYFKIQASVQDVYNALVNPNMIELWTGDDAVMDDQVGTEFSLYEGNISGKNLEIEKEKKIVQQWYFGDQEEPSIVTIVLHKDKNNTSVEVRQTNIPDEAYKNIVDGWSYAYFEPIMELLEEM